MNQMENAGADRATEPPREPAAEGDGDDVDGSLFIFSPLRTVIDVCYVFIYGATATYYCIKMIIGGMHEID